MKKSKTKKVLAKVGKELKKNPPKILAKTAKKSGSAQAKKQRKAILLGKARKAGAKIPKFEKKLNKKAKKQYQMYG